jgi:hypothetical protein
VPVRLVLYTTMINPSTHFMRNLFFNRFMSKPISVPLSRMVMVGALSTVSLLSGLTLQIAQNPAALVSETAAYAQSGSDPVSQYARAAYEIERMRQKRYSEAKQVLGGDVPVDVCRQQNIPPAVRGICDEFLKESASIIKQNGLTIAQFNDITRRKGDDPKLQQQIQGELMQLQKGSP